MTRRRLGEAVPWIGFAVMAATVAAGAVLEARGVVLGVPTPPFLGPTGLRVHPLAAAAVVVLGVTVVLAPRSLTLSPAAFAAVTLAAALAVRLAVNVSRHGPGELDRPFDVEADFEGKNEYLPALRALQYGWWFALDRWDQLIPTLPPHPAAHPPGTLLLLDALGVSTSGAMAALVIVAGVAAVPLTYATARALTTDDRARLATWLVVLSPQAILFTATSADALFLLAGMLAAWPLAVFAARGGARPLALGAAATALGSFLAWSLPAVAAWAALVAVLRARWRRAVAVAAGCAGAAAALYGALALAAGYDVLAALAATEDVYRFSVASMRPYAYWVLGSPVAFLAAAGLPVAWLALRALGRGDTLARAIGAVVGIAAVLGFTKAETERIWLFLVPFACLAAAQALPSGRLRLALGLLAVQALAVEVLFATVW